MGSNLELQIPAVWLINYLLLMFRVAGLTLFLPVPGASAGLPAAKIALAATLALLLSPLAETGLGAEALNSPAAPWLLAKAVLAESALGVAAGVCFRLGLDAFAFGAQALGFQAGYSYVNMVDPTSQVDASILTVLLTLLANLLFFAFDLHVYALRILAESLTRWPLGSFTLRPGAAMAMTRLSASMVETGVRLALPVMAVLLLIDLTLGLLNQVHPRMQLLTLSFPIKIVAAGVLLYPVLLTAPGLFEALSERVVELAAALVAR